MIYRILSILKFFLVVVHRKITTPYKYAMDIGVNIGIDNFIPDKGCWSSEPYLITVGSHCQITSGVRLFTHGGAQAVRRDFPNFDTFGKIVIGNLVYIGNNSLIMPGVTIEDNVIVASGSVVTKSISSGMVVGGNPAKIICTIDEYVARNKSYDIGTKGLSHKEKKKILMQVSDNRFVRKQYLR